MDNEKKILFGIIIVFMTLTLLTIGIHLYYSNVISNNALSVLNLPEKNGDEITNYFILLSIKSSFLKIFTIIFLAFMIILLGVLLVLKGIEVSYKLSVEKDSYKSTLETASPGLVLITFGFFLIAIVAFKDYKQQLSFNMSSEAKESFTQNNRANAGFTTISSVPGDSNYHGHFQTRPEQSSPIPQQDLSKKKPTEKELEWALEFERKTRQEGYQPTDREMKKYQEIAEKCKTN